MAGGAQGPSGKQSNLSLIASAYWNSGAFLIATAAFLFSCTSLAVKLNHGEIPTFQLVLVPGLLCFVATTAIVRFCGLSLQGASWRVTLLTLLRGLLGATSIACFYLAIEMLPLQDAVTLFFCSPVVAALLEFAVTGESHGWAGAAATACTVAGVVLVSQPECLFQHYNHLHHHHQTNSGAAMGFRGLGSTYGESQGVVVGYGFGGDGARGGGGGSYGGEASMYTGNPWLQVAAGPGRSAVGVALATCAAVANAAAFVVVRLLDGAQSTAVLTWWYHGVVVLVAAVPLGLRYPAPAVVPSHRGWAVLGVVGATQFLGQLCLNRGFQLESATRGSAINVLQVLFSFVWDVGVLGDKPGSVSMAGSALVAAGVVCMATAGKPPLSSSQLPDPPHRHHHHHHHHRGGALIARGDTDSEDDPEQPGCVSRGGTLPGAADAHSGVAGWDADAAVARWRPVLLPSPSEVAAGAAAASLSWPAGTDPWFSLAASTCAAGGEAGAGAALGPAEGESRAVVLHAAGAEGLGEGSLRARRGQRDSGDGGGGSSATAAGDSNSRDSLHGSGGGGGAVDEWSGGGGGGPEDMELWRTLTGRRQSRRAVPPSPSPGGSNEV